MLDKGKGKDKPRKSGTIRKDGNTAVEWKPFVSLSGEKFADRAGFQVAISGDSSTVAIGSPLNEGGTEGDGQTIRRGLVPLGV